ncbi:MAG: metal ABC transporter substrate-binding protein [Candidatus Paceibacterota bacterium]
MKKVLIIALTLVIVLLIVDYANAPEAEDVNSGDDKLVALSTFTIIADMVSAVGGDRIESISLTKPGAEIHGYQPTPDDLVQASKADVLFENGMNLEIWTEKLRAGLPDMPSVIVSEGVEVVSISEDAYAGKPNPHAWMSPKQGLVYVENIRQALSDLDPENAEYFAENAKEYSAKIQAVDVELSEALSKLPEDNRYLVTCEGAFTYLTKDYGLSEVYLWAINSDAQGSPQQVAKVINVVKEKIPAVFCESTVAPKIQQEVVAATNAKLGGVLYVDSLSATNGPAPTYLALLEYTAKTITDGLLGN